MIDILGYVATIITLLSFTFKSIFKLRITSCIACALWITYAALKNDMPIVFTNVAIITIHLFYLLKRKS